jgi:hypothetical protein
VPHVGGWIATMAAGTGEAAAEMNVLDHVLKTQVRRRVLRGGREGEEVFRRLNFGIRAEDCNCFGRAPLLRPQLERQSVARCSGLWMISFSTAWTRCSFRLSLRPSK